MIELIAAAARSGVIGADNRLLWRIPEDFAFFKRTTMGFPVIMGRKTWESIGRALPGRLNVVITRNPNYEAQGARVVRSLDEALAAGAVSERIFIIGGGEVYRQSIDRADRIWLTKIDGDFTGDAYFPTIPRGKFRKELLRSLAPNAKRPWRVDFELWERR